MITYQTPVMCNALGRTQHCEWETESKISKIGPGHQGALGENKVTKQFSNTLKGT